MGNRFWNNLRNTENVTYKAAIQYQRCLNKTRKCQLDLEFLYKCKENKVNPEFVRKFAFIISICYLFKVKPITSKQCSAARCFQVGVLL